MRRGTALVTAGAMAFGLTAASAIGTGIAIGSVEDVRGVSSDTFVIDESLCDGLYDVSWTFAADGSGRVEGAVIERTAPGNPDSTLEYCANAPVSLQIFDGAVGSGSLIAEAVGTTDSLGEITFTGLVDEIGTSVTPIIGGGWGVRLTVGELALEL